MVVDTSESEVWDVFQEDSPPVSERLKQFKIELDDYEAELNALPEELQQSLDIVECILKLRDDKKEVGFFDRMTLNLVIFLWEADLRAHCFICRTEIDLEANEDWYLPMPIPGPGGSLSACVCSDCSTNVLTGAARRYVYYSIERKIFHIVG